MFLVSFHRCSFDTDTNDGYLQKLVKCLRVESTITTTTEISEYFGNLFSEDQLWLEKPDQFGFETVQKFLDEVHLKRVDLIKNFQFGPEIINTAIYG